MRRVLNWRLNYFDFGNLFLFPLISSGEKDLPCQIVYFFSYEFRNFISFKTSVRIIYVIKSVDIELFPLFPYNSVLVFV